MNQTEVIKHSKVLWVSHLCIALSPLFFTVFILERERYDKVKAMLLGEVSGYQPVLLLAFALVVCVLLYKGYRFYFKVKKFTTLGESQSNESIVEYASTLKNQLNNFVGLAKLSLFVAIPIYLSGISYIYVILFSVPGLLAYISCYKVYYLKLAK